MRTPPDFALAEYSQQFMFEFAKEVFSKGSDNKKQI